MPSIYRNKSDENNQGTMNVLSPNKQQEQSQETQPGMNQPSQESAIVTSGTPAAQAPTGSSGQFQNVKAYLAANKGGGQKAAEAVKGNVAGKATGAVEAVNTTQGKIASQIDANKQAINQNLTQAQTALQDPTKATADQFATYTKEADPNVKAYNEQKLAFEKAAADAANEQQRLAAQAEAAKTEQGRQDLLYSTFGQKGRYSTGMSKLDQLLMQGEGQDQNLSKEVATEADRIAAAQKAAQEAQAAKQAEYASAQALLTGQGEGSLRDIINKQYTGLDTDITGRMTNYSAAQKDLETKLEDFLTNPLSEVDINSLSGLSESDKRLLLKTKNEGTGALALNNEQFASGLKSLGVTDPELIQKLYAQNQANVESIKGTIGSKLNLASTSDAARFATEADKARYAALNNLIGANLAGTSKVLGSDLGQAAIDPTKQSLVDMGLINSQGTLQTPATNLYSSDSVYDKLASQGISDILKSNNLDINSSGAQGLVKLAKGDPSYNLEPAQINTVLGNAQNYISANTKKGFADAINNTNTVALYKARDTAALETADAMGLNRQQALDYINSGKVPMVPETTSSADEPTPVPTGRMIPDGNFVNYLQPKLDELSQKTKFATQLIEKRNSNQNIAKFLQGRK